MDRYDRYADIFENPETAETIELGNRVLHWLFMENGWTADCAHGTVTDHARRAIGSYWEYRKGGSARRAVLMQGR